MGVKSIVDQVEKIFSKFGNFDESGFAKADLVTPEIAEALGNLSYEERMMFRKLGYEFSWLNLEQSDGIITKWFPGKHRGARYSLRLYFNQKYPKEIAKAKKEEDTNGDKNRDGTDQSTERNCQGA